MVERRVCSFCGNEIEPGTGKMYVKLDGTIFNFCKNKCQKNMLKLKRVPRTTPWTQHYIREKESTVSTRDKGTVKKRRAVKKKVVKKKAEIGEEEKKEKKKEKKALKKKKEKGEKKVIPVKKGKKTPSKLDKTKEEEE